MIPLHHLHPTIVFNDIVFYGFDHGYRLPYIPAGVQRLRRGTMAGWCILPLYLCNGALFCAASPPFPISNPCSPDSRSSSPTYDYLRLPFISLIVIRADICRRTSANSTTPIDVLMTSRFSNRRTYLRLFQQLSYLHRCVTGT